MGAELVGDNADTVGGKSAAAGVLADRLFVLRLVHAVDLVSRDVTGDPPIRHAEGLDVVVGLACDRSQLRFAEVAGSADLPFDDIALHGFLTPGS